MKRLVLRETKMGEGGERAWGRRELEWNWFQHRVPCVIAFWSGVSPGRFIPGVIPIPVGCTVWSPVSPVSFSLGWMVIPNDSVTNQAAVQNNVSDWGGWAGLSTITSNRPRDEARKSGGLIILVLLAICTPYFVYLKATVVQMTRK